MDAYHLVVALRVKLGHHLLVFLLNVEFSLALTLEAVVLGFHSALHKLLGWEGRDGGREGE